MERSLEAIATRILAELGMRWRLEANLHVGAALYETFEGMRPRSLRRVEWRYGSCVSASSVKMNRDVIRRAYARVA